MPTLQPIFLDGEEYVCLTHFAVMAGMSEAQNGGRTMEGLRDLFSKNKIPIINIQKAGWVKPREFVCLSNLEYAKRCIEKHGRKNTLTADLDKSSLLMRMQNMDDRLTALESLFEEVTMSIYGAKE